MPSHHSLKGKALTALLISMPVSAVIGTALPFIATEVIRLKQPELRTPTQLITGTRDADRKPNPSIINLDPDDDS
jgi:hypothetical protein